jgi:CheY-like chemotaxis protein
MAGKVVVINKGAALMADTLVTMLKDAGNEAIKILPHIEEIAAEREDADIYMLFAGDVVYSSPDALVYLKDICFSENKPLLVMGYRKELDDLYQIIPKNMIMKEFVRPADIKSISFTLNMLARTSEANKQEKHIVLVDDDVMFLQAMQSWLAEKYQVTATKSGMQAITFLATHKPDLILLDYEMPITNGPQVLEMIRSEPNSADIPVIFLTGKSDRESVETVLALKPDGYLLKSLPREEILAAIQGFFEKNKWENIYRD